jgi:hypothetical protein
LSEKKKIHKRKKERTAATIYFNYFLTPNLLNLQKCGLANGEWWGERGLG